MKFDEIKEKSSSDLVALMISLRAEYVSLLFALKKSELNDTSRFGKIRKTIARIMTVLGERKRSVNV